MCSASRIRQCSHLNSTSTNSSCLLYNLNSPGPYLKIWSCPSWVCMGFFTLGIGQEARHIQFPQLAIKSRLRLRLQDIKEHLQFPLNPRWRAFPRFLRCHPNNVRSALRCPQAFQRSSAGSSACPLRGLLWPDLGTTIMEVDNGFEGRFCSCAKEWFCTSVLVGFCWREGKSEKTARERDGSEGSSGLKRRCHMLSCILQFCSCAWAISATSIGLNKAVHIQCQ